MDDPFTHKGTEMKSLEHIIRDVVSGKNTEETCNESLKSTIVKNITKTITKTAPTADDILSKMKMAPSAPSTTGKELVPYVKKEVEVAKKAENLPAVTKPAEKTTKEQLPAVVKNQPETKTATKSEVATKTDTKTKTKDNNAVVTDVATATKSPKLPVIATATKTAPVQNPVVATGTKTAPATAVTTPTKTAPATAIGAKGPTKPPAGLGKLAGMVMPKLGSGTGTAIDPRHRWSEHRPIPAEANKAMKHKENKINEEESKGTMLRRKVVNVGRPDTAPSNFDPRSKLSKQSEIKTKIIDEAKKIAGIVKDTVKEKKMQDNDPVINGGKTVVYPQVIINPPIKHPDNNRDT